jgi:hypothetical protein
MYSCTSKWPFLKCFQEVLFYNAAIVIYEFDVLALFSSASNLLSKKRLMIAKTTSATISLVFTIVAGLFWYYSPDRKIPMTAYISVAIFTVLVLFAGFMNGLTLATVIINFCNDDKFEPTVKHLIDSSARMLRLTLLALAILCSLDVLVIYIHLFIILPDETYINFFTGSLVCLSSSMTVVCITKLSFLVTELTKLGIKAKRGQLDVQKALSSVYEMLVKPKAEHRASVGTVQAGHANTIRFLSLPKPKASAAPPQVGNANNLGFTSFPRSPQRNSRVPNNEFELPTRIL